jgi:glycosyltransferase involved in cell wall biosynthesis
MKTIKLTILTEALPKDPAGLLPLVKSILRPVKYLLKRKPLPVKKKYGGHYAVTRSLIQGLQKIGADFNYNPSDDREVGENVIVLSSPDTLRKAIQWKNAGKIKFLLAGPNMVDCVMDEDKIVGDPAIDYFIVPAEWIEFNVLKQLDVLRGKILCWWAGVDTQYWAPKNTKKNRDVLVYWKTEGEEFCEQVEDMLIRHNYDPIRITYRKYHPLEFKSALSKSIFSVFISRSESQGLSLTEAWSMDVPTLVWDPGELVIRGKVFEKVSACPYLSEETGKSWISLNQLEELLTTFDQYKGQFRPRQHTVKLFSDEVRSQELLNFISSKV